MELISFIPDWNSWAALLTYWAPLFLCAYGYTTKTIFEYRMDLLRRARDEKFYSPELTVGILVGRIICSILPVVNFIVALFDIAPKVFADLFDWFGKVLDFPLVPRLPPKDCPPKGSGKSDNM